MHLALTQLFLKGNIMRQLYLLSAMVVLLAACQQPAPVDTVESLAANPERLKEVERLCKADHVKIGDALATPQLKHGGGALWAMASAIRQPHLHHRSDAHTKWTFAIEPLSVAASAQLVQ
jgi:hypothetical protein